MWELNEEIDNIVIIVIIVAILVLGGHDYYVYATMMRYELCINVYPFLYM